MHDVDLSDRTDAEVVAYAEDRGCIVVSHDVNTMSSAAYDGMRSGQKMSGLLMAKQRDPSGPVIESLLLVWSASEAEEWEHQVGFLPIELLALPCDNEGS